MAIWMPKWTEVWAHIYLGKIFDISDQRDRALNEYRQALRTKDNTQGALEEAREVHGAEVRASADDQLRSLHFQRSKNVSRTSSLAASDPPRHGTRNSVSRPSIVSHTLTA